MFRRKKHPLQSKMKAVSSSPEQEYVDLPKSTELAVVSDAQYELDIKSSKSEWYYNIKRRVSRYEATMEAIPYWRSYVTVTAIVATLAFIGFVSFVLYNNYATLPNSFPLIYSQATQTWNLVSKEYLMIIPIALAAFLLIMVRINIQTYRFDRRLAIMINFIVILVNILGIIAFGQLFSLILIY